MQTLVQQLDQTRARNEFRSFRGDKQFRLQKRMAFTFHIDIIEENTPIRTKDPEVISWNPVIRGLGDLSRTD